MKKCLVAALCTAMIVIPKEANSFEIVPNSWPPSAYQTVVGNADKPVSATVTVNWHRIPFATSIRNIENYGFFWRNAYIEDWDTVPEDVREKGLDRMLNKYGQLIWNSSLWPEMAPSDWDHVPQPIRSMAFMKMLDYWSGQCTACDEDDAETLKAIVMGESWFEHRAVNEKRGNRDIGLSQASDYARRMINKMHKREMSDEDYLNPFKATEAAVLWFDRMLQESEGDRSRAVRAYYTGIRRARRGLGSEYLDNVTRIRNEYIRNMGNSPAWKFLYAGTQ